MKRRLWGDVSDGTQRRNDGLLACYFRGRNTGGTETEVWIERDKVEVQVIKWTGPAETGCDAECGSEWSINGGF